MLQVYIRGPKNDRIENLIEKMERLHRSLLCIDSRSITNLSEPRRCLLHMVEWYYNKKGKPTPEAYLLDELISERNKDSHGLSEQKLID